MKRPGNAVFVTTVLVMLAFALAALAPQTALAGWTWDEMTAMVTTPGDDPGGDSGWTWDEGRAAPATDPAPATEPAP